MVGLDKVLVGIMFGRLEYIQGWKRQIMVYDDGPGCCLRYWAHYFGTPICRLRKPVPRPGPFQHVEGAFGVRMAVDGVPPLSTLLQTEPGPFGIA